MSAKGALFGIAAAAGLFIAAARARVEVRLGRPVEVTGQLSWQTVFLRENGRPPRGSYMHPFPYLAHFPGGDLLATYCMAADEQSPLAISAYQISTDGGSHWGRRHATLDQLPMIFLPKPGDSLLALPFLLHLALDGKEGDFVGPTYLFEQGGRRVVMDPEGVRILDWPWPVNPLPAPRPRDDWNVDLGFVGNQLVIGRRLLVTRTETKKGSRYVDAVLASSDDGGAVWRYYSTLAGPDRELMATDSGYEGPSESAIVSLADGELMAVYRMGGRDPNLRRVYSRDLGRTWSKPDRLPAGTVRPALLRTASGLLVLSVGRPGVKLWVSADPRGRDWQMTDVVAYHNRWAPDPTYRISPVSLGGSIKWQTTGYTGLVEVSPDHLLLIYDRDAVARPPEQPPSSSQDLTRVFVLPIELRRI